MISSIIYETVDFIYTVGRVTFHGVKGMCSWYFNKESPEVLKIRLLDERISELEAQRATVKNIGT